MKRATKKRNKPGPTDFDAAWESFRTVPAAIPEEQVESLETRAQEAERVEGVTRRIALVVLSKPTEFLISAFRDDRKSALAFCDAALAMGEMLKRLEAIKEVVSLMQLDSSQKGQKRPLRFHHGYRCHPPRYPW